MSEDNKVCLRIEYLMYPLSIKIFHAMILNWPMSLF
jgi:hypothetical protein